jgi:hypothetical protein
MGDCQKSEVSDDGSETSLDAQLIIDFMTEIFIASSVYVANGHYRNFPCNHIKRL